MDSKNIVAHHIKVLDKEFLIKLDCKRGILLARAFQEVINLYFILLLPVDVLQRIPKHFADLFKDSRELFTCDLHEISAERIYTECR